MGERKALMRARAWESGGLQFVARVIYGGRKRAHTWRVQCPECGRQYLTTGWAKGIAKIRRCSSCHEPRSAENLARYRRSLRDEV